MTSPSHIGPVVQSAVSLEACSGVVEAIGIDSSPPMLERARHRFASDARVSIVDRDLNEPLETSGQLGEMDVVVSGFAIHHLDHDRKRSLYGEVRRLLRPGGVFANFEIVASGSKRWHDQFLAMIARPADDPEDQLAPVAPQLEWLADAGFAEVDCLWRWRGFALLVGVAPG